MIRHMVSRRAIIAFGGIVIAVSALSAAQPASAMSCFTISGKMTCMDTARASVAGFVPPVIVPIGALGDGEDHHIVIEDDGGRRVARG